MFAPLRRFGQTELPVTPLYIGCAPLGDMPRVFGYSVTEAQALATLHAAFNGPITYMDTAGAYGDGESERRIGIVLREIGGLPAGYILATKVGRDPRSGDFGGEQVKRSIERSLRLLGLDQLQIVFLHDPEHTSFEKVIGPDGPLEMLLHYKAQAIIQHIGVAGGPIDLLIRYVETGSFEAVITHNRYTLLNRAAGPLLDIATRRGLAAINAAPYGGGMLAKGPDAYARYAYREAPSAIIERVAQTLELARHPIPDEIWPQLDRAGFDTDGL